MKTYYCKKVGLVTSDECWACHYLKNKTSHGRPACQKDNAKELPDEENTKS